MLLSKFRLLTSAATSNPAVRKRGADGVDHLREFGMGLLKFRDGLAQTFGREIQQLRVLLNAHRFVGADLREAHDALRLFGVCLGEFAGLGFQFGEQVQQLAAAFGREGVGVLNPGFDLLDGFVNHGSLRLSERT